MTADQATDTGRWKGLPRRHPAAVTASRIREHITHYGMAGERADLLARAAVALEITAAEEPNR